LESILVNFLSILSKYIEVKEMSEVVSFKVPKQIKEKMRRYADRVNWAEELRRFVKSRVEELEREENIKEVINILMNTKEVPSGFSEASVREDRDSS